MSCPLVQYQAFNHLALGLGAYKPYALGQSRDFINNLVMRVGGM